VDNLSRDNLIRSRGRKDILSSGNNVHNASGATATSISIAQTTATVAQGKTISSSPRPLAHDGLGNSHCRPAAGVLKPRACESEDNWKPRMIVCKEGLPHGFCIEHSEVMAQKVESWLVDIIIGGGELGILG